LFFLLKLEACINLTVNNLRTYELATFSHGNKAFLVAVVHKKGCSGDPNNYRPISLTTNCCKVMEHIINSEMLNFLLSQHLITKQQHGFTQKRTTCTNLLQSIHDWTLNLQARRNTDVIYFDFKKAFDSVSHSKLLIKLPVYGLSGNLLAWLAEFLHNRSQIVKLNSCCLHKVHHKWCTTG